MRQIRLYRLAATAFATIAVGSVHAQITWTNVPGTAAPNTSRQIDAARGSMNDAFGQWGGMIKEQEDNDTHNWNVRKRNNTEEYLDAVYSYKTVKELTDHQAALDQKRTAYGAQIDREVARSAFDTRLYALMRREQAMAQAQTVSTPAASPLLPAPTVLSAPPAPSNLKQPPAATPASSKKTEASGRMKKVQKVVPNPAFWHGVNFNLIGANTYYSNGVVSRPEGDETVYSNGAKSTRNGATVQFSTGETCIVDEGASTLSCN